MDKYEKGWIQKFIDLLLYGNFWIATAAVFLTLQTQSILYGKVSTYPLYLFLFFATLFIYAGHRIIGISKAHQQYMGERLYIINRYKQHIKIYAGIGGILAMLLFFFLQRSTQFSLIIPGIVAVLYIFPLLRNNKRLRDYNNVKIFLVSLVWAWLTVLLPYLEMGEENVNLNFLALLFVERFVFIFSITLPFDIRDLSSDRKNKVHTLPSFLGIRKSKILSYFLLLLAILLVILSWSIYLYSFQVALTLTIFYLGIMILVYFTNEQRGDYFFTGILDGSMILSGVIVWIANHFS